MGDRDARAADGRTSRLRRCLALTFAVASFASFAIGPLLIAAEYGSLALGGTPPANMPPWTSTDTARLVLGTFLAIALSWVAAALAHHHQDGEPRA